MIDRCSGCRATVHNGRLVVDAETNLPEGTVVDLVIDDGGDDLDDDERRALDAAIDRSLAQAGAGDVADADKVIALLRSRRR